MGERMAAQGIGVQIEDFPAPCLVRKRAMVKAGMGMHTPGSPDAGIRAKIFTQLRDIPIITVTGSMFLWSLSSQAVCGPEPEVGIHGEPVNHLFRWREGRAHNYASPGPLQYDALDNSLDLVASSAFRCVRWQGLWFRVQTRGACAALSTRALQ